MKPQKNTKKFTQPAALSPDDLARITGGGATLVDVTLANGQREEITTYTGSFTTGSTPLTQLNSQTQVGNAPATQDPNPAATPSSKSLGSAKRTGG